jgi:hypothetical protein
MMTPKCPACDKPGGALTADPHCKSKTCNWNKCKCGVTYDRKTGAGFVEEPEAIHYPPAGKP